MQTHSARRAGFTLIELVAVVAILAIIATLAIGRFGNTTADAAKKVNLASIGNIQRTIDTALIQTKQVTGFFDYVESLVDVEEGAGGWTGTPGGYDWDAWKLDAIPGIYAGIKDSRATSNAAGVSTGAVTPLAEAHEKNHGIVDSFRQQLGIHYLTANEVAALNAAGVSKVLFHNFSTAQATAIAGGALSSGYTADGLMTRNGGPGQRADMSAFFPVVLTNGSPVVVLNPSAQSRGSWSAADVYRSFGLDFSVPKGTSVPGSPEEFFTKGYCKRLLLFGLGRSSDVTAKWFETPPYSQTLDTTYYRNYFLVFSMNNGTGNTGYAVKFVGVLDPTGATAKGAQYDVNWAAE